MGNWHRWADPGSRTHIISHRVVEQQGNVVVCDEEEFAGGFRVRHRDRYTLYPTDRLVEEIIEGPIGGGYVLTLTEVPDGTRIDWDFDVRAKSPKFKIVGLLNGQRVMQRIADEHCRQLAEHAESIDAQRQRSGS